MKKIYLLFLVLMLPWVHNAQITYSYGWEVQDDLGGWSNSGTGEMEWNGDDSCSGSGSVYTNFYYLWFFGVTDNTFTSPNLGTSNQGLVTVNLNYKVVDYYDLTGVPSSYFKIAMQWSNSTSGPWNTFYEINSTNHNASSSCSVATGTFLPGSGNTFIRFVAQDLSGGLGDYYIFYDDVSVTQGATPTCFVPTNVLVSNITNTGATLNWTASTSTPSGGYQYEVRTDTNPGTTGSALISSGTTTTSVLTANVSNLTASTTYYVYVRANCGGGDLSLWSQVKSFKTPCAAQNVPYVMPIDATTGSELPECVTSQDLNNDGRFWQTVPAESGITGRLMRYLYSSTLPADDWFYTKGLNLVANQSYRLKFKYKPYNYVEKLKVSFGNSPLNTAMTNELVDITTAANEVVVEKIIDFVPTSSGVYYIGFQAHSDANQNVIFVGEISVDLSPTCLVPENVTISNITKNTAKIQWSAPVVAPASGYFYEIRTSGDPGSGAVGLKDSGSIAAGVLFKDAVSLDPSTQYNVYVRSVCSASDLSVWTLIKSFTTLCSYPDLISTTPGSRCGYGTVNLSANYSNNTIVSWYSTSTGGLPLFTGANFVTPNVGATTSYFVQGGVATPNSVVKVGNGTSNSTSAGESPFYYSYGGYKHQYIYTAEELLIAGLTAGPINSVAFDVKTASSVNRLGFTIYIGTTTQNTATSTHISGLNLVYSNAAQPMNLGVNPYVFTTPFVWDGTSNIVVQVNWSNNNGGNYSESGSVAYHSTSPVSKTTYTYADNRTVAQILGTLTGGVPNDSDTTSGGTTTSSSRANTFFNGVAICSSPRTEVIATVTPPPVLTLSTNSVEICEGQTSTVTVTAGAADYNTFVWSPATGVTGNATTGWTFNPTTTTVYNLIASQSTGSLCSNMLTVNVKVNPLPQYTPLQATYNVCADVVQELNPNLITTKEYVVGTATTKTTTSESMSAFMNRWSQTRQQYIYTKQELNALGFYAGSISGLAFEIFSAGSSNSNTNYTIKIKNVTESNFANSTYLTGGFTTVFGPATYTHSDSGWQIINFTTPYVWDGTSNILIELTHLGINASDNAETYYTATADNKALTSQGADAITATTGSLSVKRLNTKFILKDLASGVWSPQTNLFTNATGTIPYTGSGSSKVYYKGSQAGSTVYTFNMTTNANCTSSLTTTINVTTVGVPVVLNQSFCNEVAVSDVVVTGLTTGATLKWFASTTSTTEITSIPTSGTYYVVQELNGCSSARVPVVITINGVNTAPVTNANQNFCGTATVGDLEATALTGNTIGWFSSETSTTVLATTDLLASGTYFVSQFNGSCWSPKASVTVSVAPVPTAPVVTAQNFCGARPLSEINFGQATNATLKWYETATTTAVLPMTLPVATGTYYVSQTIGGCESARVAVSVTVQAVLPAPAAPATQLYCGATLISDLVATATSNGTIGWFSSMTSTTPIATTQNVSSGTYYVAQFNGACWSDKTTVQVSVGTPPSAPSNADVHLCGNYNFGQVSIGQISGATLNWYESLTSTTPLGAFSSVVGGTYYVSQTVGGCESARVMITILQTDALSTPTAVSQTFCGSGTVADLVAQGSTGATIIWYNSSVALNPLSPSATLVTGTYYAAQTRNGCLSARFPISVFVVSLAGPNVDTFNLCGSGKVSDLVLPTPTGVAYKWFNSPSSSTELDPNTSLVSGTYFVSRTQFGCESARTAVTVNINTVPNSPSGVSPQIFVQGSTIDDIVMNQPNVVWYTSEQNARNGVNPLVQGMPLVNGTTYYGVIIGANGCSSLPFAVTVTVYLSDDKFVKEDLKYYPNPVEDLLTISYSDRILQIEVFDLLGKRVKAQSTDDKEVKIDLSDLASGTYIIQLKTENKSQFLKILKK